MDDKNDVTIVEFKWVYTPKNFFEEPVTLNRREYKIEIADGRIVARMASTFLDMHSDIQNSINLEINDYFAGAQLKRPSAFTLKQGGMNRIHPDGRRDVMLKVHSSSHSTTSDHVDLLIKDAAGNVSSDSRRERIDATNQLAELASRVALKDPTARKLLECYRAALSDPANELVHLFEVWEGIVQDFGGKKKGGIPAARQSLDIHERRLMQLANNEPINQGRHRGCHLHNLRDATQEELEEARSIARDMIVKYLNYKDKIF